jgi:hypothetical protein
MNWLVVSLRPRPRTRGRQINAPVEIPTMTFGGVSCRVKYLMEVFLRFSAGRRFFFFFFSSSFFPALYFHISGPPWLVLAARVLLHS